MESARKVVEKYYAAFDAHRDGWKDLVTAIYYDPREFARAFGIPA